MDGAFSDGGLAGDGLDHVVTSRVTDTAPETWHGRERRMNIRAFAYWQSLLEDRPFPSIADFDPAAIEPFRDNSLLIDFTAGYDAPVLRYIGGALRDESGITTHDSAPDAVPRGTVLSRLTDHYLEILANRAPVGFEAGFAHRDGRSILYRGILMPLSDDGARINFIYGVVSWKEGKVDQPAEAQAENEDIFDLTETLDEGLALIDGMADTPSAAADGGARPGMTLEARGAPEAILRGSLAQCRAAAQVLAVEDGRSRRALYEALAKAYDFFLAARQAPVVYAALLAESGIKAQVRAPFTPIVKLVFGGDYDKARLTEYAAVLSHAARRNVPAGGFADFLASHEGGLKAIIGSERAARRGAAAPRRLARLEHARQQARAAPSLGLMPAPRRLPEAEEFVLLLARRGGGGESLEVIDLTAQPAAVDAAIKRLARAPAKG